MYDVHTIFVGIISLHAMINCYENVVICMYMVKPLNEMIFCPQFVKSSISTFTKQLHSTAAELKT